MFKNMRHEKYSNFFIGVTFVFLICTSMVAQAIEPSPPRWNKLKYVTSILFFSAESQLEFKNVDASAVNSQLVASKNGKALPAREDSVKQIVLDTNFFGKSSRISLFFEPNLNALQRTQLETGKRNRYKAYRFLENGVYSLRISPQSGQESLPYSEWDDSADTHFKYPAELDLQQPVIDSSSLFYIMNSGLFSKPGDNLTFTVFVKDRLLKLVIVAKEFTELEVDYLELRGTRKDYIEEEEVKVLRVIVNPLVYDAGNNSGIENSEFEFLGLKDNLEFYIDTKKRLLVQLSGKIDVVGIVDIVLNKAEFK